MPVLIAARSADLDLVRPLARLLRSDGGEVRCYLDTDDHELRHLGCKIAVGALDDAYNLEAALTNVHTFVPVLTDPFDIRTPEDIGQLRDMGLASAEAAAGAGIAQTILPIPVLPGIHPVTAIFAEVEKAFDAGVHPLCRLRTGYLWGDERPLPALISAVRHHGVDLPEGVCVSVLGIDAWAAAVAAADDREDLDGTWELGGEIEPLVDLLDRADRAPANRAETKNPPDAWGLALLTEDLIVGSSADEFA
ncbi:MAG: hypothetical protein JWL57_2758 [Actinobacteria bacterium]|nr:hypothetical protein [Actinomycetota bacterium]